LGKTPCLRWSPKFAELDGGKLTEPVGCTFCRQTSKSSLASEVSLLASYCIDMGDYCFGGRLGNELIYIESTT
jgi:hypothetical protein